MQLRRAALLVTLVWPAASAGDERVDVRTRVSSYRDDDATTVLSPRTRVTARPLPRLALSAGWAADVVTSASVDVTSSATKAWSETRHEGFARASWAGDAARASVGAVHSRENDWSSTGLSLGGSADVFDHAVTLSGRWGLSLEQVGRAGDEAFGRSLTVHALDGSVARALSRRTLASLGYSVRIAEGIQHSVYRFVPISSGWQVVPERHPDERLRHAVTARLAQHLVDDVALHVAARLYLDDWGVVSETAEVQLRSELTAGLRARLRARGYHQSAADFYQDDYDVPHAFVSRDRELSPVTGVLAGLKIGERLERLGPLEWVELDAKLDVFRYRYPGYDELGSRLGCIIETGLGVGL